jgi:cobyrinic acid a,c-diamide synthase
MVLGPLQHVMDVAVGHLDRVAPSCYRSVRMCVCACVCVACLGIVRNDAVVAVQGRPLGLIPGSSPPPGSDPRHHNFTLGLGPHL